MTLIPFAEWLPDLPPLNNPGATVATNVYPRSDKTYGPLPAMVSLGSALPSAVLGAISVRDEAGTAYSFVGTATKLYKLDLGAETDVSKAAGTYGTVSGEAFRFAQSGNYCIATNMADAIQKFELTGDTEFSDLSSDAPKARHVAQIKYHLVVANTWDALDGDQPARVWWSEIGNPTSWPTPATSPAAAAQSGFSRDLPGGWIQGITGAVGGADGLVFSENAIHRMSYIGSPDVFQFDEIERGRGTRAPGSIINVGPFVAYLGIDGFYMCNGAQSVPIGNGKIDKTFIDDLDDSNLHQISAAMDMEKRIVIWSYPRSSGGYRWILWNWMTGWWARAEIETEWLWPGLTEPFSMDSGILSLGSLDAKTISLDSRVWTGGLPTVAAFNTSHENAVFGSSGETLEATIETAEITGQNGRRLLFKGFRPLVDVQDDELGRFTAQETITGKIRHRSHVGATLTDTAGVNPNAADFMCRFRVDNRYGRAQVVIAQTMPDFSGIVHWTQAIGIEPEFQETGKR